MKSETELQDAVERHLIQHYGSERVRREVYLPSGRVCDFVVDAPPGVQLALEVEHNADPEEVAGDLIHGAGQALLYAGELYNAVPVVLSNSAEGDRADLAALRQRVPILEWSPDDVE